MTKSHIYSAFRRFTGRTVCVSWLPQPQHAYSWAIDEESLLDADGLTRTTYASPGEGFTIARLTSGQSALFSPEDATTHQGKKIGRKLAAAAIAIALIWTSSAFADQMTITKTANPIERSYPGVSLDILGVKPGMSLDAVKKVLIANYHSQPISQAVLTSLTYKSINMSSQPYVTLLSVNGKHGSMTVYFGGPATGNTVVQVYRVLKFPDVKKAPTVAAVRAALDKKYGPETKVYAERGFMRITGLSAKVDTRVRA